MAYNQLITTSLTREISRQMVDISIVKWMIYQLLTGGLHLVADLLSPTLTSDGAWDKITKPQHKVDAWMDRDWSHSNYRLNTDNSTMIPMMTTDCWWLMTINDSWWWLVIVINTGWWIDNDQPTGRWSIMSKCHKSDYSFTHQYNRYHSQRLVAIMNQVVIVGMASILQHQSLSDSEAASRNNR